jgi:hypothetical protein
VSPTEREGRLVRRRVDRKAGAPPLLIFISFAYK